MESKVHCLRLHGQSIAHFAPSAEDDIDQLRKRLTAYELCHDSGLTDWVMRGSNFSLSLSLRLPDELQEPTKLVLIDTLSNQMNNSEVINSHLQ